MRWTNRHTNNTRISDGPSRALGPLCQATRAALSAQLDGETSPPLDEQLHTHLSDCPRCQAWQESLHQLTRRVRVTTAREVPDRTPALTAAVIRDQTQHRPAPRLPRLARVGLIAASLAQLLIIIPAMAGNAGLAVPPHAARELGAFNLALAVGFLAAALRPERARLVLLIVAPTTALLVLLAVLDTLLGETTLLAETPHLIAVVATALLTVLARHAGPGAEPSQQTHRTPITPRTNP